MDKVLVNLTKPHLISYTHNKYQQPIAVYFVFPGLISLNSFDGVTVFIITVYVVWYAEISM